VYLSCDPSTLARDLAVLTNTPRKPKEIVGPSVRYEISEMHLLTFFRRLFTSKRLSGCEERHEAAGRSDRRWICLRHRARLASRCARNAASVALLSISFLLAAAFILTGVTLARIGHVAFAAIASLLSWTLLGFWGRVLPSSPRRESGYLAH